MKTLLRSLGPAALALCAALTGCSHNSTLPAGSPDQATATGAQLFDVYEAKEPAKIGQVSATTNGLLRIVSAVPGKKQFLQETVELVNNKPSLFVEAPAAPGAPQYANASRTVPRSSPEFLKELRAYLQQYYDLTLKPAP